MVISWDNPGTHVYIYIWCIYIYMVYIYIYIYIQYTIYIIDIYIYMYNIYAGYIIYGNGIRRVDRPMFHKNEPSWDNQQNGNDWISMLGCASHLVSGS